jgi:uncharacterized membrane protein
LILDLRLQSKIDRKSKIKNRKSQIQMIMDIPPAVSEWLNLLMRWAHVFAAILWVGTTYFFTWLDGRFTEAERAGAKDGDQVWMVHSGGFYVVEKRKALELGRHLHWFRFEALLTWVSGFILLIVVYYLGGALVDPDVLDIKPLTATGLSIGVLIVASAVYDILVRSPLSRNEVLFASVSFVCIVGLSYGLTRIFSGRGAYIHLGAAFGTIMVTNVWNVILPAQKKMIAALKEGKLRDEKLSYQAKLRSKHNTFMAVPAVFTMISNHFPVSTYGHEYNWVILSVLVLAGFIAAKIIRRA